MNVATTKVTIVLSLLLLSLITAAWLFTSKPWRSGNSASNNAILGSRCKDHNEIRLNVERLASDVAETKQSRERLIVLGGESADCRTEIISQLLGVMDKPQLSFLMDRSSYFRWLNGAIVLGKLKAVESLDLLIEHLDLTDGSFSASMSHQPAILGVESMGPVAVPKLRNALEHHASREIRLAAALCLANIGESEALTALKDALTTETDPCVKRFISLSLVDPNSAGDVGELLRQRILAFRCGN